MSKNVKQQIESILLVATKPLKISKLKDFIPGAKQSQIDQVVVELKDKYNQPDSGLNILDNQGVIQLTTCQEASEVVKKFIKDETTGELTRPSLETLTIIAYRQPITKSELEQIRGVNCSMILRNLLIRGLIIKREDKRALTNYYCVTVDFLKFLGINNVTELPDYEKLNSSSHLQKLLNPDWEDEDDNTNDVNNANDANSNANDANEDTNDTKIDTNDTKIDTNDTKINANEDTNDTKIDTNDTKTNTNEDANDEEEKDFIEEAEEGDDKSEPPAQVRLKVNVYS